MKYVAKKIIKKKEQFYVQYKGFSRYIGTYIPENIKIILKNFIQELTKKDILPYSKLKIKHIDTEFVEKLHHKHALLNHELFKHEHDAFYLSFAKLFTYNSNKSEGSKTSQKEVDSVADHKLKSTKAYLEVKNSLEALNYAFSTNMKWNLKHIKHIHHLLLKNVDPLIAGRFKNFNNVVGNSATTDHKDVSSSLKSILESLKNNRKNKVHPLLIAVQFYYQFEHIHPFQDGNGRTGRILLNAILRKYNYPPIVFFAENHEAHSNKLKQAIEDGSPDAFFKHCVKQMKKTYENLTILS